MRRRRKRPGIGRTPRDESILKYEEQKNRPKDLFLFFVAGDEGFEPPNGGTRTHCLTTWRIPIGFTCRILIHIVFFCKNALASHSHGTSSSDEKYAAVLGAYSATT